MDITEFPSGVIEHLGWYVYRLIDPRDGSTFYVGKGKGNRVFAHMRGEVAATDDDELLSNKLKQIREIRLSGNVSSTCTTAFAQMANSRLTSLAGMSCAVSCSNLRRSRSD
uniref:LEM-3-like GIY-YIG domain-containing protein n=1 Tax=Escherichia coli TaxID=562 RepID=UPI0035934BA5